MLFLSTREAAWYIMLVVFVCLSDDNFRKPWHTKFIFAHLLYLHALRVEYVYEGHRVKVKVTVAENVQNVYFSNVNLYAARGFRLRLIEWCDGSEDA